MEGFQFLLACVQEVMDDNHGRVPSVQKVAEATGLEKQEAKELLDECKPLLKKRKVEKTPEPVAAASASAAPAAEPKKETKGEAVNSEAAKSEAAPAEPGLPTRVPPDNQLGDSQVTQPGLEVAATHLDTPTSLGRSGTQRPALFFCASTI